MNNQFERKDALVEKLIACTNSENYKIKMKTIKCKKDGNMYFVHGLKVLILLK